MTYAWTENIAKVLNDGYMNYDQYCGHLQEVFGCQGGFKRLSVTQKHVIILYIGSSQERRELETISRR